jgi:hypothetical protein
MARLPKTNWDKISDDLKMEFFYFYLSIISNNLTPQFHCINSPLSDADYDDPAYLECEESCELLFPKTKKHMDCPCDLYGNKAFAMLQRDLFNDGWIPEKSWKPGK